MSRKRYVTFFCVILLVLTILMEVVQVQSFAFLSRSDTGFCTEHQQSEQWYKAFWNFFPGKQVKHAHQFANSLSKNPLLPHQSENIYIYFMSLLQGQKLNIKWSRCGLWNGSVVFVLVWVWFCIVLFSFVLVKWSLLNPMAADLPPYRIFSSVQGFPLSCRPASLQDFSLNIPSGWAPWIWQTHTTPSFKLKLTVVFLRLPPIAIYFLLAITGSFTF